MNPLIVVRPTALTESMLVSATVAENDHAAWSSGATYALGARVIRAHRIWESAVGGNVNNDPATGAVQWIDVKPTNRWAMFDRSHSTATAAPSGSMSYTLRPAIGLNAFAALNVRGANTLRVRLTHPVLGTIYDRTLQLSSVPVESGWWAWFFGAREAPQVATLTDLPGIPGCDLVVDFTGTAELAIGVLLFGQMRGVGEGVLQGSRLGIQDASRKERTEFGDTVLVERAYWQRAAFSVPVRAEHLDATITFLTALRAVPCLYIASRRYSSAVLYGYFKDFEVVTSGFRMGELSLQLEGLT